MKCPSCPDAVLTMADRQGVEIDYCPQCRGVWLDRGELDKLIERAAAPMPMRGVSRQPGDDYPDSDDRDTHRNHRRHRKSWMSEIFD